MPLFLTERDMRSLVGWDDMPEAVDIIERAYREKSAQEPAVVSALEKAGLFPDYRDPEATRQDVEREHASLVAITRKLGLVK